MYSRTIDLVVGINLFLFDNQATGKEGKMYTTLRHASSAFAIGARVSFTTIEKMKTMKTKETFQTMKKSAVAGAVAVALFAPSAATLAQTSNAQSAMLALELDGSFVILGDETWRFDSTTAATLYENVNINDPVTNPPTFLGCTPTGNCNTLGATPPADPNFPFPAPPVNDSELQAQITQDKCTMFDGGFLGERSYTKEGSKRVGSPPNHRDFRYRYTYAVRPDLTNPNVNPAGRVDSRTAWELQSSTEEPAMAMLSGFVAGQSTSLQKATKSKPEVFKVSHTILDNQGNPRVTDLQAVLTHPDGFVETIPLGFGAIESGADFLYRRTLGSANGSTSQLIDNWMVSEIQTGFSPAGDPNGQAVLSSGGNQDNFAGNDTTNGERVFIQDEILVLAEPGEYGLIVSGAVKGVQGSSNLGFNVSNIITVDAEGCTPTP